MIWRPGPLSHGWLCTKVGMLAARTLHCVLTLWLADTLAVLFKNGLAVVMSATSGHVYCVLNATHEDVVLCVYWNSAATPTQLMWCYHTPESSELITLACLLSTILEGTLRAPWSTVVYANAAAGQRQVSLRRFRVFSSEYIVTPGFVEFNRYSTAVCMGDTPHATGHRD